MLNNIPTYLVVGFLGAGKTTVIQELIAQKKPNERWAVLVNEFGAVGLDAQLMASDSGADIVIHEVPGGCMCCAAGAPMTVALNRLLKAAKPDVLLIEPTGLGHPKEILKVINGDNYRQILTVKGTITLVDARNIQDDRYTTNTLFKQQIEVADVIVASKADKYGAEDLPRLNRYLAENFSEQKLKVTPSFNGRFNVTALGDALSFTANEDTLSVDLQKFDDLDKVFWLEDWLPNTKQIEPYVCRQNRQGQYYSIGWTFSESLCFLSDRVELFLSHLNVLRAKGVLNLGKGRTMTLNQVDNELTCEYTTHNRGSRLEFINDQPFDQDSLETKITQLFVRKD